MVTFGMNRVWCDGTQPAGTPAVGVGVASGFGSVVHGKSPGSPWVRTGNAAAATAAGLVDVWSSIRLLMTRGCESKTSPFFCAYDVGPGGPKPVGTSSAALNTGVTCRGNGWSAAPKFSRPGMRLLHEPSTVRRPYEERASGIWLGPVPTSAPQGPVADVVLATCVSAILICSRMNARSEGVTVKPWPTGATAALATMAGKPRTTGRSREDAAATSRVGRARAPLAAVLDAGGDVCPSAPRQWFDRTKS